MDPIPCIVCAGEMRPVFGRGGHEYFRCRVCGLVSTLPVPSEGEIERHYAAGFANGNYALLQRFAESYRRVYRQFLAALDDVYRGPAPPEGRRLLEIGCFTGDFLELALAAGYDVTGFELQPEAAEIAGDKLPGRILRTDIRNVNLPSEAFDVICLLGLIEHVPEPVALLERCAGLLKPKGCLLIETPDARSLPARLLGRFWPPLAPVEHIHLFSERALRRSLERWGLRVTRVSAHWKRLPVEYVHAMMEHFGPELRRFSAPVYRCLPGFIRRAALPFYAGEMIVVARAS